MPNVLTLGTFDLLHPGHLHLFRACERLADGGYVTVAVNADTFVETYKGRSPVQSGWERSTMIKAIRHVNRVIMNPGGQYQPILIDRVAPDLIVIGDDW